MAKAAVKDEESAPQPDSPHGLGRVEGVEAIQAPTLVGDVRDLLLQEMRDVKNALPWTSRGESEQRDMIDRAGRFAQDLVRQIIDKVAATEHPSVRCMIDSWTVKDGIKIMAKAVTTPDNIMALSEGTDALLLVFVSADSFGGERAPITPLPDQGNLLDGDDDGPVFDNTPSGDR